MAAMRAGQLAFFTKAHREHGDVVRFRFGWATAHLVAHPDAVRHVLVDNAKNYDKQTPGFDKLRRILGNGLLTSEGAFWLQQRRIAQPGFSRERVARFSNVMVEATDELVDSWLAPSRTEPVDVAAAMMFVTLRIAGLTLLSTDFTREARAVGEALNLLLLQVQRAVFSPVQDMLRHLPTPHNRRVSEAMAELRRIVRTTVETRRKQQSRPDDLLTMLLEARDEETGQGMSDQQLCDEVLTIFLAGHETTANALAWTLLLSSQHPGELAKVTAEVEAVLGGEAPTAASVQKLTRTRAFVMETMRLYPPAWMITRHAVNDDSISGYPIPRDSLVFTSPYVTHRHPSFFPNPEGFNPERFVDGGVPKELRSAYFPFGMGPRLCIGQSFAMMEAVLIFARILQRVTLSRIAGEAPRPQPSVTLRPAGPVLMDVSPAQLRSSPG
jgi:cytochrome P450